MKRAPKFSQRSLDEDFEKFLKESLSDDSIDSEKLNKYFSKTRKEDKKKEKEKESQPWWMREEDDGDEEVAMVTKKDATPANKWMKPKKESTPVAYKEEKDTKYDEKGSSKKESDAAASGFAQKKSNFSKDSLEDLSTTGKTKAKFDELKERSGVIPAQASFEDTLSYTETGTSDGLTPASTGPGMETLEELADKERFFKELEAKKGGIVDYRRLMKEDMSNTLGSNMSMTMGSMPSPYMGTADEHSSPLLFRKSPVKEDEGNTDDPSSETSPSQLTVHPSKQMASAKKGMLSKVALLDTGDSMMNTVGEFTRKGGGGDALAEGNLRTASTKNPTLNSSGFLGVGTATEMEALQAALREAANTPTMDFSGLATDEPSHDDMRTVHDVIREVREEKERMQDSYEDVQSRLLDRRDSDDEGARSRLGSTNRKSRYAAGDDIDADGNSESELQPTNDGRGFDLQPSNESRGIDLKPANESRGFDLQPSNESQGLDVKPSNEGRGFDLQPSNEGRGFNLQPSNESRGFNLQPSNESRGFDLQPSNESRGFDLQPSNEGRGFDLQPSNEGRGFDLQPSNEGRGFGLQPAVGLDSLGISADDENSQRRGLGKQSKRGIPKRAGGKPTSSRYSNVRGSGYGKSKTAAVWSPVDAAKQKVKGSEVPNLQGTKKAKQNIMASVESFAHYIQEHFVDGGKPFTPPERPIQPRQTARDESQLSASARETRLELVSRERALIKEVAEWQAQWKEEHKLNAKLKAEMEAQQREAARREEELLLSHQRELFKLKQDNTVLQAKLNVHEGEQDDRKRALSGRGLDGASQEEIKLMQKEIVEQETLLQGYQQENERLYSEVRRLQKSSSEGEDKLLKDNQKLLTEVANLKELLEQKDVALRNKGLITGVKVQQEIAAGNNTAVLGAGRIAELQEELREAQLREASLQQRLRQADDASQELKQHIGTLVRDKEHSQQRVQDLRDAKQREFQDLQQQHKQEIEMLNKKVRWYAENQELLDKDAVALREKDGEIQRLKETLEKINKQTNQKTTDAQRRAKERAADAKRILDLERQVKEMNDIIRRRHPNSLPALIYAAAASDPGSENAANHATPKSHTVAFLEAKVKKMEAELDEKEKETKMFARVLEQKYNVMKFQYEDRLQALEKQLKSSKEHLRVAVSESPRSRVVSPGKGLEDTPAGEAYRARMMELKAENEDLKRRLGGTAARLAWMDEGGKQEDEREDGQEVLDKESLREKLTTLAKVLSNKDHEIDMLKATCEKLMNERFQALSAGETSSQVKGEPSKVRDKPVTGKKTKRAKVAASASLTGSKQYQPENFSGTDHVSDVLTENQQLKQQLDHVSLDMEQQRISFEASLAHSEGTIRRTREETAEQLACLRASHAGEIERLVTKRALDHSDSGHAKLLSQLDTQKVMIKHLQEQLLEARVDTDTLSAARVRERLLQTQLEQLNDDLREAKETHSPEMRHFEALQAKIANMETRHSRREQELQELVTRARHSASYEKDQELAGYQRALTNKNRELQQFRSELDAILEVLRELQRQGVVLPLHSHVVQSLLD